VTKRVMGPRLGWLTCTATGGAGCLGGPKEESLHPRSSARRAAAAVPAIQCLIDVFAEVCRSFILAASDWSVVFGPADGQKKDCADRADPGRQSGGDCVPERWRM